MRLNIYFDFSHPALPKLTIPAPLNTKTGIWGFFVLRFIHPVQTIEHINFSMCEVFTTQNLGVMINITAAYKLLWDRHK
ncbi:MAG: hypothetical protein CTY16_05995 [Methylobacter sp.]|nr:MAG: hypothetical protein CTY16_05995 [Methylobacter sp.]